MGNAKNLVKSFLKILSTAVIGAAALLALLIVISQDNAGGERIMRSRHPAAPYQARAVDSAAPSLSINNSNARDQTGIPVLCYHYLRKRTGPLRFAKIVGALLLNLPLLGDMETWTMSVSAFRHQMEYLKTEGYDVISLDDLSEWRMGNRVLKKKSVVLTFDDADRSVYELAYPILKEYGFQAVVFVVTSRVGMNDWEGLDVMNWDELEALHKSGVFSIQSHTHNLHYKVDIDGDPVSVFSALLNESYKTGDNESGIDKLAGDLLTSSRLISSHTGEGCRFLAWPYGFGDAGVDSVARLAGFEGICTLRAGLNRKSAASSAGISQSRQKEPGVYTAGYDPFNFNALWIPEEGPPTAGGHGRPGFEIEIKRYTISARTSMHTFKKMLRGEISDPECK